MVPRFIRRFTSSTATKPWNSFLRPRVSRMMSEVMLREFYCERCARGQRCGHYMSPYDKSEIRSNLDSCSRSRGNVARRGHRERIGAPLACDAERRAGNAAARPAWPQTPRANGEPRRRNSSREGYVVAEAKRLTGGLGGKASRNKLASARQGGKLCRTEKGKSGIVDFQE